MWRKPTCAGTGVLTILAAGVIAHDVRAQTPPTKQPSAEDVAAAATLFKEAKTLAQAEKLGPACDKFAESERLDPHLGTLLYLATCHELLGKTASAWAEFTRAIDLASRSNEQNREQLARSHAAALEARLSKIAVVVRVRAPDMHIEINGREKDAAALADPLPVDPGEYTVRASAPGHLDWVRTITVAPGPTTLVVEVPPLAEVQTSEPARAPGPAPTAASAVDPHESPQVNESPRDETRADARSEAPSSGAGRTAGIVVLGVAGLAGLGVGSYFGLTAFALKHRADSECRALACNSQGLADHNGESTDATISTISFGVGLAALAAGAYLFLSSPKDRRSTGRSTWIAPEVGFGSVGIAGGAVW